MNVVVISQLASPMSRGWFEENNVICGWGRIQIITYREGNLSSFFLQTQLQRHNEEDSYYRHSVRHIRWYSEGLTYTTHTWNPSTPKSFHWGWFDSICQCGRFLISICRKTFLLQKSWRKWTFYNRLSQNIARFSSLFLGRVRNLLLCSFRMSWSRETMPNSSLFLSSYTARMRI